MSVSIFKKVKCGLLALAAWVFLGGCSASNYTYHASQIKFQTIGSIPVVVGTINGKRAWFIVDTGASVSILNEVDAPHFGFKCFTMNAQNVVGFGGESKTNEAFNCRVELGPMAINGVNFRTRNLTDFTDVIQQHENISISGILGADVFNRYKMAIDFNAKTIIFKEKIKETNFGLVSRELP